MYTLHGCFQVTLKNYALLGKNIIVLHLNTCRSKCKVVLCLCYDLYIVAWTILYMQFLYWNKNNTTRKIFLLIQPDVCLILIFNWNSCCSNRNQYYFKRISCYLTRIPGVVTGVPVEIKGIPC